MFNALSIEMKLFPLIVFALFLDATRATSLPPPCNNGIYCYGRLLHTVQVAKIFRDSKEFVDMKLKYNYDQVLKNFEGFMASTNNRPTKHQVKRFVLKNFEKGDELEKWTPNDYKKEPSFLEKISNLVVKDFARELNELWPVLARKVKPEVFSNQNSYSFIPVPHGFIVPGGRFREYYYWDSYWIIKGLLISDMGQTARGMIDNFIHIVKKYGFIPNGGRIYYLDRSQPPLLTKMAATYYEYSADKKWLKENIKYLDKELVFWLEKKTVQIKSKNDQNYLLAHYSATSTYPRPESYLEDLKTASIFANSKDREELYIDIKSGAESGWDFSSRWIFGCHGNNNGNLTQIQTRRVIPVDLNAFLCEAFFSLSNLYQVLGNAPRAAYWYKLGKYWQDAIDKILYSPEDGIWYDFDLKLMQQRKFFYPSNLTPLWSGCFKKENGPTLGMKALKYLNKIGVLDTPGGVSTSDEHSGEQWDYPNAWAPLQAIIVQGLERSGDSYASNEAKRLAYKWLKSSIRGFRTDGAMFEKYNVNVPGKHGGGGEYEVQSGFGWTNGVALEFINDYFVRNFTANDIRSNWL